MNRKTPAAAGRHPPALAGKKAQRSANNAGPSKEALQRNDAMQGERLTTAEDYMTLGKPQCPMPVIGMRVKLAAEVPGFIRELTEPGVRNAYGGYRRPPALIGTVVKVVGDPLEQKRVHTFKYRRCNQTGATYPVAMWCDVRWDAPASGTEVTTTGYHTGRFGLHYLVLVDAADDPMNDPKNIRLRKEKAEQLELQEAVARRIRAKATRSQKTSIS
jgi:hypothetical protein